MTVTQDSAAHKPDDAAHKRGPAARLSDPDHVRWYYAIGYMVDFVDVQTGQVGWRRLSHRGIQEPSRITIPRKQKNYIFNPKLEFRINTAFEQVVQACADVGREAIQKRIGKTWLTPEFIQGLLKLHAMGCAHSFETWQDGQLAGGVWGIQVGGLITMSSMFHRVSNAGKAAFARGIIHLGQRGFRIIDMGMVPDHLVNYGIEWWPRWKLESLMPELLRQTVSVTDARPMTPVPLTIRLGAPLVYLGRRAYRKLTGREP